jgi:hypothetical protein
MKTLLVLAALLAFAVGSHGSAPAGWNLRGAMRTGKVHMANKVDDKQGADNVPQGSAEASGKDHRRRSCGTPEERAEAMRQWEEQHASKLRAELADLEKRRGDIAHEINANFGGNWPPLDPLRVFSWDASGQLALEARPVALGHGNQIAILITSPLRQAFLELVGRSNGEGADHPDVAAALALVDFAAQALLTGSETDRETLRSIAEGLNSEGPARARVVIALERALPTFKTPPQFTAELATLMIRANGSKEALPTGFAPGRAIVALHLRTELTDRSSPKFAALDLGKICKALHKGLSRGFEPVKLACRVAAELSVSVVAFENDAVRGDFASEKARDAAVEKTVDRVRKTFWKARETYGTRRT